MLQNAGAVIYCLYLVHPVLKMYGDIKLTHRLRWRQQINIVIGTKSVFTAMALDRNVLQFPSANIFLDTRRKIMARNQANY